jgi:hypothetical protein
MQIIKLCLAALAAVLALSAVAATGASATEILFSSNVIGKGFKSTGGIVKFVTAGGAVFLECRKVTNQGTFIDQHLGKVSILFEECTEEGFKSKCETSGNSLEGHITLESEYHLGLADPGHLPALLLLLKELTLKCSIGGTIKVKGSIIGLLQNTKGEPATLDKPLSEALLTFEQKSGKQNATEFLLSLAGGAKDKAKLEISIFGGEFGEAAEESKDTLREFTTTSGEIELIEG